ncbi:MAG: exodeoxyribonuclease III [Patescibacteria group bacterium]
MKLASWNVNGLRAVERKGLFRPFLVSYKPDIVALQEIKVDENSHKKSEIDFPGFTEYYNHARKPGYSGTAVLLREGLPTPKVTLGIGKEEFDGEGRVITLEFEKFYFVNAYFPHTRHDLSRLIFKQKFNIAMFAYIKKLDKKKPVIFTGDYNVAHEPIDLARPKDNDGNPGFHPLERKWVSKFLKAGFTDTFRSLHPKDVKYTWWSMRFGARKRNVGWRIDYFCVSERIAKKVKNAAIHDLILGSDHCPVTLEIDI